MFHRLVSSLSSVSSQMYTVRTTSSSVTKEKWDLITAVCIERKPIIAPPLTELEVKFKSLLAEVEYESSLKSDHEVRHEADVKQMELLKKGQTESDPDVQLKQTAQDFLDLCTDELAKFKPAEQFTVADRKNNPKSLLRKLDKNLVFVINKKIGNKKLYILPQAIREDGETLKQTAERTLKQACGDKLKCHIYGNAPSSFYKYKYPRNIRKSDDPVGAKIFIYFARYLNGSISDSNIDYKWLDRNELRKCLPENYKDSVLDMLIDE